jgi:hypothetical protein
MKIYLNGFSVTDICPSFDLEQFEAQLPLFEEFQIYGRDRALSAGRVGNYIVGLLASATGQNKDLMLIRDPDGRPHFVIRDTSAEGERQAFNFFAINMRTGMGLLSRYFGAGSVTTFGKVLRSRYLNKRNEFRDEFIASEIEAGEDIDEDEVRKEFAVGKFVVTPVFREGTFEELLASLRVITELTYDEPNVREPKYEVVRDQLRLDRRQLKFEIVHPAGSQGWRNIARGKIVDFIREKILGRDVRVATVHGKNAEGDEMPPVTLSPEVDSFGEYRYNDVVVDENMELDNIAASPFIKEIVGIARDNAGVFETPIA